MQLVITQGQLSDLFFNYEHPERDRCYADAQMFKKGNGPTEEAIRESIAKDAKEFADCYGDHADVTKEELAAWLADDFLRRV